MQQVALKSQREPLMVCWVKGSGRMICGREIYIQHPRSCRCTQIHRLAYCVFDKICVSALVLPMMRQSYCPALVRTASRRMLVITPLLKVA